MLIKVTIRPVVTREHTVGIIQVAKRGRQRGYKAVTPLTQKEQYINTHFCILKAIHDHFQEFCENLRPFVLKKFIHNFTKLVIRIKTVH